MKNDRGTRKYYSPHIFVFGLIAVLALVGLSAASAQAQCTGSATISTANVNTIKNVPVTIPVTTTDVTGLNIFSVDFFFDYNPSVISYTSVTNGPVAPTATLNVNTIIFNATSARLVISGFDVTPFSGAGTLVNINFNVVGATTTTSPLTLGNFRYNGGAVCTTLSSGTLTIVPAATTTTVTSNNSPSLFGENVTFTATVSSTPVPATGGTVDFVIDGIPFAGCIGVPLVGGTAMCTTNTLPVGNHSVMANYSGSVDFASSSGTGIFAVVNATVVTLGDIIWTYYDDFSDTVIPNHDFVFGPTGQPLGLGSARFAGGPASGNGSLKVLFTTQFAGTKLADITALSYQTYGDSSAVDPQNIPTLQFNVDFDLTDAIETFQGRVVYTPYLPGGQNGTVVNNIWQTWNVNSGYFWYSQAAPSGTQCSIASPCTKAQMLAEHPNMGIHNHMGPTAGDYGFLLFRVQPQSNSNVDKLRIGIGGATPNNKIFDFEPGTTTTTVTCPPTQVYTGAPIEPCTYQVTGTELTTLSGMVPSGNYSMNTNVGTASASYTYPGDANHSGSTNSSSFQITKADQTINFPVIPTHTYGDADFTISATATSMLPVSFSSDSPSSCSVTGNLVHIVTAGFCSIRATQAGNGNYNAAPDNGQTFTINKANQTISFPIDPTTRTYGDPDFTVSATATSMLPVSFTSDSPSSCSVTGNLVHIITAGFCSIRASQGGNINYNPAVDAGQTFTINKANAIINVTPYNVAYDAMSHTATGTATGVEMPVGANLNGLLNLTGTTHTNPGTYNDTWTFAGNTNYNMASGSITDQINSGSVAGMINYAIVTKPVPGVTMSGAGTIPVTGTTDAAGNYLLNNFGAGAYTVTPSKPTQGCTPVNVTNGIFSFDASHVARYVVGLETFEPEQLQAAQVNGFNLPVSSFDAALIAQKVVGICGTAGNRSGQWVFVPGFRSYGSVIGNLMGENYLALMRGDVDGDWSPTGPNRPERPQSAEDIKNAIHMTVYGGHADRGNTLTVPVKIDNLRGAPVEAYQFDIAYDPRVVTPDAIAADVTGTLSANMSVVYNIVEPGLLKVAVYGAYPASGDGLYLNLRFVATGRSGSRSALHVDNFFVGNGTAVTYTYDGEIVVNGSLIGTSSGQTNAE